MPVWHYNAAGVKVVYLAPFRISTGLKLLSHRVNRLDPSLEEITTSRSVPENTLLDDGGDRPDQRQIAIVRSLHSVRDRHAYPLPVMTSLSALIRVTL